MRFPIPALLLAVFCLTGCDLLAKWTETGRPESSEVGAAPEAEAAKAAESEPSKSRVESAPEASAAAEKAVPDDEVPSAQEAETVAEAPPDRGAAGAPPSDLEAAVAKVTPELLRAHVEFLAADRLRGRATPSPGLEEAATYIASAFEELGLRSPEGIEGYHQTFACGVGADTPGANVIGVLPGSDPELGKEAVMVTAHYDHIGESASEGIDDVIYNGANDNASGVSGMLGIAAALGALPTPPRRSVVFVAFCGEELGLRGSRHYAQHPVVPLSEVAAMVNLEMLGRPLADRDVDIWVTGYEYSNLGEQMREALQPEKVGFISAREVGPVEGAAFDRSDNLPLAEAGVVAHAFSVGKLDALYHHVDDEPERLDFERMAVAVRGLTRAIHHLTHADARPDWTQQGRNAGYGG